ncbi:MAG: glycosyltransferase family 39 protein [Candidatus Omnitrophota bacterium]
MRTATSIIILVLFSASLFLIGLGAMPLTDPDETFYAETAKEMLNRREFLTPYIFGKPQFEKPPLYYWSVMLSFMAFGVNEFSARASSALFGILGVIGIYLLGKLLINKRTGFFAGIVLATSIKYLILSRACVTDMLLGVLILYAFLFFFYGYFFERGKTKWYLLSSVFLALAVLTKGPIGIFLPVVIIGIYLILAKEIKKLKEIPFVRGILLFLVISLPWYLLMYRVHGKGFIDAFFGFHNIIRFLEPEHALGDVFYYYIPVMIAGFLPWAAFLPLGVWQIFRETEQRIRKTNLLLIIWFLVIFIFFSLSRTKLPTYIFPLYPALALLTGRLFDVFLKKEFSRKMEIWMKTSLFFFLALFIMGVIGSYIVAKVKYPTVANAALVAGAVFALPMLFFVIALLKKRYAVGFIIYMAAFIVLTLPLTYIILPELGKYESSKIESKILLTLMRPGEKLGAETRYVRGVAFYTDRENVLDVHPHHVITRFLDEKERVWCLIKEKNHIQLYEARETPYGKPTYVVYKFGKKVIVTNKMPPDGKFLMKRSRHDY